MSVFWRPINREVGGIANQRWTSLENFCFLKWPDPVYVKIYNGYSRFLRKYYCMKTIMTSLTPAVL